MWRTISGATTGFRRAGRSGNERRIGRIAHVDRLAGDQLPSSSHIPRSLR